MIIILGIDPGSRITGFGVIQSDGNKHLYITSGCVQTVHGELPTRLRQIFSNIADIIRVHKPVEVAIEHVFMRNNVKSAFKLEQARGAAMAAVGELTVAEYSPRQIKQAVVGYGGADKIQVQHMVKSLLKLSDVPPTDAADALAVAVCHAHRRKFISVLQHG